MEKMTLREYLEITVPADRISLSLDLVDKTGTVIAACTEPDAILPAKEAQELIFVTRAQRAWAFDVTVIDAVTYDESIFGVFIRENDFFTSEPEFD